MVKVNGELVEFSFFRPRAEMVHLAGDFNAWRDGELPMTRTKDGYWTAQMRLPVGNFKFRYCADGQWFADYAAFGIEPGPFGFDSVVRVAARTLRVAQPSAAVETAAA